jgi:putative hemolysin
MKEQPNPTFALSPVALPQVTRESLCPSGQAVISDVVQRPSVGKITVSWARHQDEVRAAQRLRYEVFVVEMGASLPCSVPGNDIDLFDDYCEHLLVRDEASSEVIGTYRVLTPTQAKRAGSTYSNTGFNLTRLRSLRARLVELGRSCVHADHRSGGVILALWGALAEFIARNQLDTMIGCASIWRQVRQKHLAPIDYHVTPRLGAKVLGAPAWDPDFNSAYLPMMMRIADLPPRYLKHFIAQPAAKPVAA